MRAANIVLEILQLANQVPVGHTCHARSIRRLDAQELEATAPLNDQLDVDPEELVEQLEAEGIDDDETNRQVATILFRLSILYIQNEKIDDAMDATNEALRVQKSLGDTKAAARDCILCTYLIIQCNHVVNLYFKDIIEEIFLEV